MTPTPDDLLLLRAKAKILFSFIFLLWAIHILNWGVFGGRLNSVFSIRPRDPLGLLGVVTSHFFHLENKDEDESDKTPPLAHIRGNTQALLPLGRFVLLQGIWIFYIVSLIAALVAGVGTWLFASSPSVGFSGVIFGYIGFLIVYGFVAGSLLALLIALLVVFLYGRRIIGDTSRKMFWGILPGSPKVAWMMHLFGFIGGIIAAYYLRYLQLNGLSFSHYGMP